MPELMLDNSLIIPTLTDGTAFYTIKVTLDGSGYIFHFNFSSRELVWYLDVKDEDNNLLLANIKLVPGYYLCEYQKEYYNLFPGDLLVLTGTTVTDPPGLYDLGEGAIYKLVYVPVSSLIGV